MPWKIKTLTHSVETPRLHLHDKSVNINLVTYLDSGVVDIYVGADHPLDARIWFSVDNERHDVVMLERVYWPSNLDLSVIRTVLLSMHLDAEYYLGKVRHEMASQRADRQGAWPEYTLVVDEPHHGMAAE